RDDGSRRHVPPDRAGALASAPGSDDPAARREASLRSIHVRIECGTDRAGDPRASVRVRFAQSSADRPEPGAITRQFVFRQRADHVDRPDVDLGPTALLQDGAHATLVGEAERPRYANATLLQVR